MNNREIVQQFIKTLKIKNIVLLDDINDFYQNYVASTRFVYQQIYQANDYFNESFTKDFAKVYNKLRNSLMDVYRLYVKGDILRASSKMNNILFSNKYNQHKLSEYFLVEKNNLQLYRCRYEDKTTALKINEKLAQNDYHEMFHIPFNLRNLVDTCRFSMAGFPCLYLASSLSCCKGELNVTNNINKELIACKYVIDKSFSCYDFTLDSEAVSTLEELKIFLLKYLLVHAISYTLNPNIPSNKNFVSYYVISKLIMASIVSRGYKENKLQCIRYRSVKFIDDNNQFNYVFIPKIKKFSAKQKIKYDEFLYQQFKISKYDVIKDKELVVV